MLARGAAQPRHAIAAAILVCAWFALIVPTTAAGEEMEYQLLATKKTSTMEKELNQAAEAGFRFEAVMGGETLGGSEVVVVMSRPVGEEPAASYEYTLLATSKTSTMQKELQAVADEGYAYCGQTVFSTAFGGEEVVVILERGATEVQRRFEYLLLGTKKTSTMQKELTAAGQGGYELVGLTVSSTTFGGQELVSILRRPVADAGTETSTDEAGEEGE